MEAQHKLIASENLPSKLTEADLAAAFKVDISNVTFASARTYLLHIAVNGTSFCGSHNNDGFSFKSGITSTSTSRICLKCLKAYVKSAKVSA